jgi:hypothetical protein
MSEDDGFLSRWSRRKQSVREGRAVEPEPAKPAPAPIEARAEQPVATPAPAAPSEPPPTLDEVEQLTPESDFRRFVAPDAPPDVKNAALKKLFSDPRFNQQDGLDVYIDDYSRPDPIPAAMLRQLASAKFLKLFDDEQDEAKKAAAPREPADHSGSPSVAQSQPHEDPTRDADADLRLQQDHAPGRQGSGDGAE